MLLFPFLSLVRVAGSMSIDEGIKPVLEGYVSATLTYDVPALDRVFSKEYIEVSPLGEVDERATVLEFYRVPLDKRGPEIRSHAINDLIVRQVGRDISVAIFREDIELGASPQTMKLSFRVTSVLHKEHGQWRLFSNQFTGIRKKNQ